eukprot:370699-Rhodomonas_salina.2
MQAGDPGLPGTHPSISLRAVCWCPRAVLSPYALYNGGASCVVCLRAVPRPVLTKSTLMHINADIPQRRRSMLASSAPAALAADMRAWSPGQGHMERWLECDVAASEQVRIHFC